MDPASVAWLHSTAAEQLERFEELVGLFEQHRTALAGLDCAEFAVPYWTEMGEHLSARLSPRPGFDFLRDEYIRATMFVFGAGSEFDTKLSAVETHPLLSSDVRIAAEDAVGRPELLPFGSAWTSHNTIHHLYHLTRFAEETRVDLRETSTIAEWGGGYGNLAKLVHRIAGRSLTYVIVDLPLLSCLQWLYLSTVFGPERVHLIDGPGQIPEPGKINLLPVPLMAQYEIRADLFISTWALSESSPKAQDYVVDRRWFGADHVMLAYQKDDEHREQFVAPTRLERGLAEIGAQVRAFPFAANNYYAFA